MIPTGMSRTPVGAAHGNAETQREAHPHPSRAPVSLPPGRPFNAQAHSLLSRACVPRVLHRGRPCPFPALLQRPRRPRTALRAPPEPSAPPRAAALRGGRVTGRSSRASGASGASNLRAYQTCGACRPAPAGHAVHPATKGQTPAPRRAALRPIEVPQFGPPPGRTLLARGALARHALARTEVQTGELLL